MTYGSTRHTLLFPLPSRTDDREHEGEALAGKRLIGRRTHGVGEEEDGASHGGAGSYGHDLWRASLVPRRGRQDYGGEGLAVAVEAHPGTTHLDLALLDLEKRAGGGGKGATTRREEDHDLTWASTRRQKHNYRTRVWVGTCCSNRNG